MTELQNELLKDSVIEKDYIIMDGQTYYVNASIYDDCYNEGNFIGTFIMKRIEFEYAETVDFKQKEFKFYKSFKVGNGWQTIDYGTFIVQAVEQSDTGETVKVTAYDYALKFAQTYQTELDYASGSITLWQVFEEILNKVQVETDVLDFTNASFIVDSNQFVEGYSYGNVMAQIAGISGNFAHIYNDKLCLIFTNDTGIVIEKGQYSEFEDKRDSHPITIVAIEDAVAEGENIVKRWEEGIVLYGENYLTIKGNLFAYTQDKRQQLIDALFDKIKGFSYSAMKLTDCLFPSLKCGDKVQIRAKDGTLVDSIILRWQNSDYSHTLEAPSMIKATVEYEVPKSSIEIARRTEIIVDKQNQQIESIVSEQTDLTNNVTQIIANIEGINSSVTSLDSNLEELKTQVTQTTEKLELSISRSNGNNLVKNSDMSNNTEFWQAHLKAAYAESDTPPESPNEGDYWYCTSAYDVYQANQMYKYTSNAWIKSDLTRKILNNSANLLLYTTSYENDDSKLNTASGRYIRIDVDKDYPDVTHSYNSTNLIPIDSNEKYITISLKIKNNIKLGTIMIGLGFIPNFELPLIENPEFMYEPTILLTPDDYNNSLHEYSMTIKIPDKSEYIPVATGPTPPTDTTKYWMYELRTGIGVVMQYDGTNWVQRVTTDMVYEENTNIIWTYRGIYGAYYKTNYTSDLTLKSITPVVAFYGGFALVSSTTSPEPQKGLYWLDTTSNKCFRAKYNGNEFDSWEDTGLTATWVSQNIMPIANVPFVPPKGYFEFSDLKVEWNSISTRWNRYQGEIYSKNFRADENGLTISSGKNTMFIDEDEILATYNNINIFGINEDLCFTRRFKAEQEMSLGNYKWYLATVNNNIQMLLN